MGFLDSLGSASQGLGSALFPTDPTTAGVVDPSQIRSAQGDSLFKLGLGLMAAPYSMNGTAAGALGALNESGQSYNDAMDRAFKHTLIKRELDNQGQDRDFLQKERTLQLKGLERTDRQQAAMTAGRVLTGLNAAQDPNAYLGLVQNDPEVKDALSSLGISPVTDPSQVGQFKNALTVASQAAPAPAPIKLGADEKLISGDASHTLLASGTPSVEWKDGGNQWIPVHKDGTPASNISPISKTLTPDQQRQAAMFGDDDQRLIGALTQLGVAIPGRSKETQSAALKGLRAENPTLGPEEIAQGVKSGQLTFHAQQKSTGQLLSQLQASSAFANNIDKTFANLEPLVGKLDKSGAPLLDRAIANIKAGVAPSGDVAEAQQYIAALAPELAKLRSGALGNAAPAEGEIKDATKLMLQAYNTDGFAGMKRAIQNETKNKRASYAEQLRNNGMKVNDDGTMGTAGASSAPAATNAKGWTLHVDAKGNQAYVSPDGKQFEEVK